jgi:hypothetical protein
MFLGATVGSCAAGVEYSDADVNLDQSTPNTDMVTAHAVSIPQTCSIKATLTTSALATNEFGVMAYDLLGPDIIALASGDAVPISANDAMTFRAPSKRTVTS